LADFDLNDEPISAKNLGIAPAGDTGRANTTLRLVAQAASSDPAICRLIA